ncbi:MAG: hypothetical protein COB20_16500 [SAR86 cluster bacterium]|uniref:Uncharacterized protein n=1 Tax=SAR86 cluster bacterium TaxID=2030880 RepID=A0A2A4WRD7_9GAMM|nr:MAG: hypothetical protein COB20_16500 [SAR86 cluster bacterium]
MAQIVMGLVDFMAAVAWRLKKAGSSSRKPLLIAAVCLFLASCIGPNLEEWPDSIPQAQVFRAAYDADKENQARQSETEYLKWVLSFYQGNLAYQSGWQDIQGYIYAAPAAEAAQALLEQLSLLGIAIGSEWSKANDIRRIDTRMLSLWGSTIQLAPDFATQKQTVEVIAADIDLLLSGTLRKQDIFEERYADILGLELFGDF